MSRVHTERRLPGSGFKQAGINVYPFSYVEKLIEQQAKCVLSVESMGQATSTQPTTSTVSNKELSALFSKACAKQFQPIELLQIKKNMEAYDKDQNQLITQHELNDMIGFPEDLPHVSFLLFECLKVVCRFPLLTMDTEGINFHGLIKALTLLNRERYSKLFKDFEYLKFIFISLAYATSARKITASTSSSSTESQTVVFKAPGVVAWSELQIVKQFDNLDVDTMYIEASDVLDIITFLLVISRLEPTQSLRAYRDSFTHFEEYKKKSAISILRAMNHEITLSTLKDFKISFKQFSTAVNSVVPNLFAPLKCLLEQLLFQDRSEEQQQIHTTSRLVNEYSLAQLSTYLRRELVYSNIRKLYVGADSGFSMRSFESKAFKWNAPTLLLLRGRRISKQNLNPRYKKFEASFPSYKGPIPEYVHEDDELIYGVYLDQPWRISNKETFGNNKTMIFQMAPIQRIYQASLSAKHFAYFNTLGGGIGFGSEEPTVKNNFLRYNPGNVSLTLDSTMEFAVFRHLGLGGEFKSVNSEEIQEEWEDRFLIQDVEVWGIGGEKELEDQNKRWEWEQQEAKRRQQINLKSMGEDRAILEMAGLIGQHQSGGSV